MRDRGLFLRSFCRAFRRFLGGFLAAFASWRGFNSCGRPFGPCVASARASACSLIILYRTIYKSGCGLPGVLQIKFSRAFLGLLSCCSSWGRLWLFAGCLCLAGYMSMQVIKRACVAFCAACAASYGLPRIYGVVARSAGFPWAFGAFCGYWSAVLLSAFCASFKGAAGPPEYINQWPQLPRVLGAFWGRLRAFRASAGICAGSS